MATALTASVCCLPLRPAAPAPARKIRAPVASARTSAFAGVALPARPVGRSRRARAAWRAVRRDRRLTRVDAGCGVRCQG